MGYVISLCMIFASIYFYGVHIGEQGGFEKGKVVTQELDHQEGKIAINKMLSEKGKQ